MVIIRWILSDAHLWILQISCICYPRVCDQTEKNMHGFRHYIDMALCLLVKLLKSWIIHAYAVFFYLTFTLRSAPVVEQHMPWVYITAIMQGYQILQIAEFYSNFYHLLHCVRYGIWIPIL